MRKVLVLIIFGLLIPFSFSYGAGEVDVLWQGEVYTPPLYRGLPLWTSEARITFVAMPNLPGVNPANLIYRWSKDGTVLGSLSGVGKRSLVLVDGVLSLPLEVKVDIRTSESEPYIGSAVLNLRAGVSRVLVVENNPLYGLMLNKAIGNEFSLKQDEVTFAALPLFATVSDRKAPVMSYTWNTNTGDKRMGNSVTYRAPEDSQGSSLVTLDVVNTRILSQPPRKSFVIQFDNQEEI